MFSRKNISRSTLTTNWKK